MEAQVHLEFGVHLEILKMAIAGMSFKEIAARVCIAESAISTIVRSPLAQAEIARRGT